MNSDFSLKMVGHYRDAFTPRLYFQDVKYRLMIAMGRVNGELF